MTQRKSRSIGLGALALLAFGQAWLGAGSVVASAAGGIDWRSDLRQAGAEAQAKNRLIWLQFTGPWCHFCNLMDRESFVHPRIVGQSRDNFVPIKLQSEGNEELVHRFGVEGLPATVIVTPTGQVVAKNEGYVDPETFHTFLESALKRFAPPSVSTASAPGRPKVVSPDHRAEVDVALAGYCPVSLVEDHQLVEGKNAVTLKHEGHIYRFANPVVRNEFQRQPERFIPVNGGRCPVSQVDQGDFNLGDPRFGILYQGHLYLCKDEASRARFLKLPERYSHVDLADRGLCAHCWGHDYLRPKGHPQWSISRLEQRTSAFSRLSTLEAWRDRNQNQTRR